MEQNMCCKSCYKSSTSTLGWIWISRLTLTLHVMGQLQKGQWIRYIKIMEDLVHTSTLWPIEWSSGIKICRDARGWHTETWRWDLNKRTLVRVISILLWDSTKLLTIQFRGDFILVIVNLSFQSTRMIYYVFNMFVQPCVYILRKLLK